MARRDPQRSRRTLGLVVFVLAVALFIALFLARQSAGTWSAKTTLTTDFRTISGLRRDSKVQLAGVEIGEVTAIDFVSRKFPCNHASEDEGRHGDGRSNDCDAALFCAPGDQCAELEPYVAKGMHAPCLSDEDCGEAEVCVNSAFRRKAKRVYWGGSDGVCARYNVEHRRVRVTMTILAENVERIGGDSVATVVSNGPLGDQLVNITPGSRGPLPEDHHIMSAASFSEQLTAFREHFDRLADKVDSGLSGISSTFAELNQEQTIESVKRTLTDLETTTRDVAQGRGRIGGLLNDPSYQKEFSAALAKARDTADFVDRTVAEASGTLTKVETEIEPKVDAARKKVAGLRKQLDDLDPSRGGIMARLLRDSDGKIVAIAVTALDNLRIATALFTGAAERIERGEGTLGALVRDTKLYSDMRVRVRRLRDDWKIALLVWLAGRVRPE